MILTVKGYSEGFEPKSNLFTYIWERANRNMIILAGYLA